MKISLFFLLFLMLSFSSCGDEVILDSTEERNKFVGSWFVTPTFRQTENGQVVDEGGGAIFKMDFRGDGRLIRAGSTGNQQLKWFYVPDPESIIMVLETPGNFIGNGTAQIYNILEKSTDFYIIESANQLVDSLFMPSGEIVSTWELNRE